MRKSFVIGVDFGTDSVRSIIVDTADGNEIASSVFYYPRWRAGLYCNPNENLFRQHPLDYIEGLEHSIKDCLSKCDRNVAANIKAISVDTTGSTPVAVDKSGMPLALTSEFAENPNAMFVLWKDHTATREAHEINEHIKNFDINYLQYVGGIYSSEWFWAKLLHILRKDAKVAGAIASWVEHCDWIPFLLTGGNDISKLKRSVCSAGHKALWSEHFNGLPPNEFFATLDSRLDGFTNKLFSDTFSADQSVGFLSREWSERLGLSTNVLIGVGAFDAHMGAVGGQIEPYHLSKVMGTSTCDMMVVPVSDFGDRLVNGICGQVLGSVIPGMVGLEAGQSAFGDAYAWYRNLLMWPLKSILKKTSIIDEATISLLIEEIFHNIIPTLNNAADEITPEEDMELALDWLNGRRTPDADQTLKGALTQINLGSDAPRLFRAIAEATCFGAKAIVNRFVEQGLPVKGLIGIGGVAKKSPFIMQMMADVMNMPIRIHRSEQTCALGAAMFAATVAGVYEKVEDAMIAMGQGFEKTYYPDESRVDIYQNRFFKYEALGRFAAQYTTAISKETEIIPADV